MIKGFPIDFLRQTFEQTLLEQHIKNNNYFGGDNQVRIFSLYEQLRKGEQVDRYVCDFEDLMAEQNRNDLIMNGVISAPSNPSITNLYTCTIIPLEYNCFMRCKLENRDQALETLNNLVEELKGSKVDIAELKCADEDGYCYIPFVVGTIGHNEGEPKVKNGDFIGEVSDTTEVETIVSNLAMRGFAQEENTSWLYCEHEGKIKVAFKTTDQHQELIYNDPNIESYEVQGDKVKAHVIITSEENTFTSVHEYKPIDTTMDLVDTNEEETTVECECVVNSVSLVNGHIVLDTTFTCDNVLGENFDSVSWVEGEFWKMYYEFIVDDGTHGDIIFPPEHESFKKYKMSISLETMRCESPKTLNAQEYCVISFGGSATIQDAKVKFGNDLVKVCVSKYGYKSTTNVTYANPTKYWLEPLEMPSGNNANTRINQLVSNNFKSNSQTDSITLTLQYSFVADYSIPLLKQWFRYGRYGAITIDSSSDTPTMTPNLIYTIKEIWSAWGEVDVEQFKTRIVDTIDVDNTEGDTMTLGVAMQIQGDND